MRVCIRVVAFCAARICEGGDGTNPGRCVRPYPPVYRLGLAWRWRSLEEATMQQVERRVVCVQEGCEQARLVLGGVLVPGGHVSELAVRPCDGGV